MRFIKRLFALISIGSGGFMFKVHELIDWTKLGSTCKSIRKANELIEAAIRVAKVDFA